jgi:hypothetical protein
MMPYHTMPASLHQSGRAATPRRSDKTASTTMVHRDAGRCLSDGERSRLVFDDQPLVVVLRIKNDQHTPQVT